MKQTLEIIARRRSLRRYDPTPLSGEEKNAILDAARSAPTAGNMMLYTILEITDQAIKDRLAVTCDNQPFIATAPLVLIFLADYQRWWDTWVIGKAEERARALGLNPRRPEEGDLVLAACDALIAAQNAVIAAESLGIGSCYIGDILENYETHCELLNLPPYAAPICMLCFGRPPADEPQRRQQPRLPREAVVQQNRYRRIQPEDVDALYQAHTERYYPDGNYPLQAENYGQVLYLRKFTADFSREMSRSVRAMLARWREGEPG